jgi:protein-S-isoprenylcysteine O-methyltransferase Ste14
MAEPAVVRALAFYVPLAGVVVAALIARPDRRRAGAALLAGLWNLSALLAVNLVAVRAGWWRFDSVGGELAGVPFDALLGWALLWGALPALLPERIPAIAVVTTLVWVDLVAMPAGAPVLVLGDRWLLGEALGVVVALIPGLVLARLTVTRRRLPVRAVMQVVLFASLLAVVGSQAVLHTDGAIEPGETLLQIALQATVLLSAPALAAVRELASRGRGTPFPYDPPDRLVSSGPYAYVANPMQVSCTLLLVAWAVLLGSWALAGMAVVSAAFAAGVAGWHEDVELERRHGPAWPAYRRQVAVWRPRWRPWDGGGRPAALYVASGCDPCEGLAAWLSARSPVGIEIRPAVAAPFPVVRLTYIGRDGYTSAGVAAFARALEHLHLGWAWLAWVLLLPGVGRFVQLVVDAVGGGPLADPVGGAWCECITEVGAGASSFSSTDRARSIGRVGAPGVSTWNTMRQHGQEQK